MKIRHLFITSVCTVMATPVAAQIYTLQASGYIYAINGGGPTAYTSDGRIAVNDPFSVTVTYNTSAVISSTTTNGTDIQTIYQLPTTYSYTAGSYSSNGSFNILIVDDNHNIGSTQFQDGISFVSSGQTTSNSPFDFGTQPVYTSLQVDSYDQSQTTLDGTGLDEVSRFTAMPNQFVEIGFTNSSFDTSVLAMGNITASSFASDAPEPAGWVLMLSGFGIAGAVLRRRRLEQGAGYASVAV